MHLIITLLTYSGFHSGRACQTCTLAHHLNLGSLMVRASYWSSEGCGFDPRLGLRSCFWGIELDERSSIIQVRSTFIYCIIQAPTFPKYISKLNILLLEVRRPLYRPAKVAKYLTPHYVNICHKSSDLLVVSLFVSWIFYSPACY